MPLEVPLLYRITLAVLFFFVVVFTYKVDYCFLKVWEEIRCDLMGIALNLQTAFGKIAILTMLILPIQEHGRFFYFMLSSSISFFKA